MGSFFLNMSYTLIFWYKRRGVLTSGCYEAVVMDCKSTPVILKDPDHVPQNDRSNNLILINLGFG
jgi:hypothetical protein